MRKSLVLIMVLLLAIAAAGLVGCGGNSGQAKTDMQSADAAYNKVKTELDNLQGTLTGVLGGAVTGNYSALTAQTLDSATAAIDKVLAAMPAVKADFEKLAALTGVADYTAYANAMVKAIDANTAALIEGKKVIDQLKPLIAAGNTAAIAGVLNQEEVAKLQSLGDAATKAYEDAQSIKAEKNLGK
ncbi:MAG: hypothetical protein ACYC99_10030 [Candidatus Geothermincolia bacterium]